MSERHKVNAKQRDNNMSCNRSIYNINHQHTLFIILEFVVTQMLTFPSIYPQITKCNDFKSRDAAGHSDELMKLDKLSYQNSFERLKPYGLDLNSIESKYNFSKKYLCFAQGFKSFLITCCK